MGRMAPADLPRCAQVETVIVAEYRLDAAAQARVGAGERVQPLQIDAEDVEAVRTVVQGSLAVINTAQYRVTQPITAL